MAQGLSPEQIIYDLATAGDPQVSPDGTQVLFTRSQAVRGKKVGLSQIWMCAIDGSDARALDLDGQRNSAPRWSPDGEALVYVSNSDDGSALVYKSFAGGSARELVFHASAISAPAWSPDGQQIAYNTEFDPENPNAAKPGKDDAPRVRVVRRLDYKQDNRGFLNDVRQHVWVVDCDGNARRRVTQNAVDYLSPAWSPDGTKIAVKVPNRNGMRAQLAIVDVESGEETLVGSVEGNTGCWSWSPDGSRLLIAGDETQTWQYDLFLYDLGAGTLRRLTDDLAFQPDAGFPTVSLPSQPVWIDASTAIVHGQERGASGLFAVDVETAAASPVVTSTAQHVGLSADAAARCLVQSATSA
ncbi:MAG: TolB family protein, partial [Thermomicrobiales bacterium]